MRHVIHWFRKSAARQATPPSTRLAVESLETRLVPYALSGNAWPHPELVTLSFVPDGTVLIQNGGSGITSNLFNKFNTKFGSAATWQKHILKAAQQWAANTNINFAVVADNGSAIGSGAYQQGDSGFGDVRLGGYIYGNPNLATAYYPPPINNYSLAGDVTYNTGQTFNIGSTYDLYTVSMHEIGHALGLGHGDATSVMSAAYPGTRSGLATDDINGIRALYSSGAARAADAYDAAASNGSFATASNLTATVSPSTLTALIENLDLTTSTDKDYYSVTVPAGTNGTMVVKMQSSGLSLLSPKLTVYASDQITVKGIGNGVNQYGATVTVTVTGVSAGQTYYFKMEGAETSTSNGGWAFNTGKYAVALNFGTNPTPSASSPNTMTANGSPLSSGGGIPVIPGGAVHDEGAEVLHPEGHDHDDSHHETDAASHHVSASPGTVITHTQAVLEQGPRSLAGTGWDLLANALNGTTIRPTTSTVAREESRKQTPVTPAPAAEMTVIETSFRSDLLFGALEEVELLGEPSVEESDAYFAEEEVSADE